MAATCFGPSGPSSGSIYCASGAVQRVTRRTAPDAHITTGKSKFSILNIVTIAD